jgi:hypothetical protein
VVRAEKLPDLGRFQGLKVGQGEAGIGAPDIGDEGAGGQHVARSIMGDAKKPAS